MGWGLEPGAWSWGRQAHGRAGRLARITMGCCCCCCGKKKKKRTAEEMAAKYADHKADIDVPALRPGQRTAGAAEGAGGGGAFGNDLRNGLKSLKSVKHQAKQQGTPTKKALKSSFPSRSKTRRVQNEARRVRIKCGDGVDEVNLTYAKGEFERYGRVACAAPTPTPHTPPAGSRRCPCLWM